MVNDEFSAFSAAVFLVVLRKLISLVNASVFSQDECSRQTVTVSANACV